MKNIKIILCASAILLFSLYSCNNQPDDSVEQAEDMNQQKDSMSGNFVAEKDADFAVKAASGGMAEVEISKLAGEKSSNQAVKDFADMMVRDHSMVNEQLKTIAAAKNITLPDALSQENQEHKDDLSGKTGQEFDKAYMDLMEKDHKRTIDLFEDEIGRTTDPELKQFATETLPSLKSHLESCKRVQDGLK